MDFQHTEDRRMLADTLHRFILDKYHTESRNGNAASETGFSREIWAELAELGVIGALFSEQDGGFGGDAFDIAVVFEAIGYGLMVEPFLDNAILAGGSIAEAGTSSQKELLAEIIAGTKIGAFAHYEPENRYEICQVTTTARQQGEKWILNGDKAVIKHAEQADFFVVSARTSGSANDESGISLFIVPVDVAGLNLTGYNIIDGGRAAELLLQDVELDGSALLGEEGKAFSILEKVIGIGVLALSAEALGSMEAAKAMTVEYLQTRKQFGAPIGKFQALQHRMADILMEIEQVRSSVQNAAAALGKSRTVRERKLSAAKYTVGKIGRMVSEETIQMHGGMGMAWELPMSHYAKRLIMIDHELGDEDYHLNRYIQLGKSV